MKPTIDELKANIQASLKAIEDTSKEPTIDETPSKEIPNTEGKIEETEVKTEEAKEETVEKKEEKKEEPHEDIKEEVAKQDVDYKKKFVESTREAQILYAKNAKIYDAVDKANSLPEPTEEELRVANPEWDDMSVIEKRLATDNLKYKRSLDLLGTVTKESKELETWHKTVDTFVEDPKSLINYPDLEGKVEEFKEFASKKSRKGVDFDTLVGKFLYDISQSKPKHKGEMFPTGSGGAKEKPKVSDKVSMETALNIRDTNYNEYVRLLKAGKIESITE